jgi:hypothetical protein
MWWWSVFVDASRVMCAARVAQGVSALRTKRPALLVVEHDGVPNLCGLWQSVAVTETIDWAPLAMASSWRRGGPLTVSHVAPCR